MYRSARRENLLDLRKESRTIEGNAHCTLAGLDATETE
jgi:hypothetical protein